MLNLELGHPRFCQWVRQTVKLRLQCSWKRAKRWVRVVEAAEYLQGATLEVTVLGGHGRCGVGQQVVAKNSVAEGLLDMLHGVVGAKVNSVVVRSQGGAVTHCRQCELICLVEQMLTTKEFGSLAWAENHALKNGLSIQSQRRSFKCDHVSSSVMKARAEVAANGLATKPRGRP